jgi:DNA-binding SARP family transcriptional activator
MSQLKINLLGKFSVRRDEEALDGLDGGKVQELFGYLLLNRNRPHPREALANALWGGSSTAQSKKYLRQALWHLQSALEAESKIAPGRFLVVEPNWIKLSSGGGLWLDVEEFESAFALVQGKPSESLDAEKAESLRLAVELYRGDLLEGSYQDWFLYERERLQNIYLAMLDKLTGYCEISGEYEQGQDYAARILRYDPARERTHRRLIRLYYLAGDRSAALRQYARCVSVLKDELGVKPDVQTVALCERVRSDSLDAPQSTLAPAKPEAKAADAALPDIIARLKQLHATLSEIQQQVQKEIRTVELALNRRH